MASHVQEYRPVQNNFTRAELSNEHTHPTYDGQPSPASFNKNGPTYTAVPEKIGRKPSSSIVISKRKLSGWLFLVALITALVVGAALGGGLGSALAHSRKNNSNNILSSANVSALAQLNPHNFTVTDASTVANLSVDCQAIASQSYTYVGNYPMSGSDDQSFNNSFRFTCGQDLPVGAKGEYGAVADLNSFVAYRLEDCVAACVSLNANQQDTGGWWCGAVLFDTALSASYMSNQANCFLKNDTSNKTTPGAPSLMLGQVYEY